MTAAEITVGMPCFNNARTVARAIASVRAQTEVNWRLLLSDDASDDASWEICEAAAADDPRIVARRQDSRRHFMNFGDLLDAVETPYFAWLAADDYWAPDFLRLTRARLDDAPGAVSALPRCVFVGPNAPAHSPTPSLDGPPADRIRRYLAHPGGTRMYGLFRTTALKSAFPKRSMNAYDWYLMVGVLKAGAQVEVPVPLLFREYTHWMRYSEAVPEIYSSRIFRRYPTLDMSLQLLRHGQLPPANLGDLYRLNLRKHEEYLAVMHPDAYRRRAGLFRLLNGPISTDPGRIAAIAGRLIREAPDRREGAIRVMIAEAERGSEPAQHVLDRAHADGLLETVAHTESASRDPDRAPPPLVGSALPPLTAILTCRNVETMLERQLDHLQHSGAQVIVIDHGSTDRTRDITQSRIGQPVAEIVDEPFDGTFDLTRQLRVKGQIIAGLAGGWVLHIDADEFLDASTGQRLRDWVGAWDASDKFAAGCEERLFLPASEQEVHAPDSFEKTMRRYVIMAERDPKQRLFRADAPLETWMQTGGHTICRDAARIVPERLLLRHYLGLSLDEIRAKYYARVFAREDIGKHWHRNRVTALKHEVVAPDESLLRDVDAQSEQTTPLRHLPIFAPLPPTAPPLIALSKADLLVLSAPSAGSLGAVAELKRLYPELRIQVADDRFSATCWKPPVPLLNLLEHPVTAIGESSDEGDMRRRASDWVQRIAVSRQAAQSPGRRYRELRIEDAAHCPGAAEAAIRDLVLRDPAGSERCVVSPAQPEVAILDWPPVVARIAGPLARDLSYR